MRQRNELKSDSDSNSNRPFSQMCWSQLWRLTAKSAHVNFVLTLILFLLGMPGRVHAESNIDVPTELYSLIEQLVKDQKVAGAQVVTGIGESQLVSRNFGVIDVRQNRPVDNDTQFCIGSCSKTYASCVLLALQDEKPTSPNLPLDLDEPIDRWIPEFSKPKLDTGKISERAPTLRELLSHHGGVYSQRKKLTESQVKWIRDFRLPLSKSVAGIATEPFICEPGTEYNYSGAGYCVLGRVAELVTGKEFNELLAQHVCKPLGLKRTTYFPEVNDSNVAVGHTVKNEQLVALASTPHLLGKGHRLALIGGSIYSPASEAAEFARLLLNQGTFNGEKLISTDAWQQMTTIHHQLPAGGYGLGVSVFKSNGNEDPVGVTHGGSLNGCFSRISANFETRRFGVVVFTGNPSKAVHDALQEWIRSK